MSSNLKVNTILPSVGSNIGIGTNGGELNVDGGCKVQVGTALTLGHSIGLQYATQNLHSAGFEINQINASGIVTASHFYGNGANLTGITQTTINNNANNRLITGSGTANTLEAESGLTFDGSTLSLSPASSNAGRVTIFGSEGQDARLSLVSDEGDDHIDQYNLRVAASNNRFYIDQFESGAFQERFTIANGGNIGIGGDQWAKLVVTSQSTNTSLTGHNYLASQSGMSIDNTSNTNGSFGAYTARVKNSGGTQQSGSLAFKSVSSGYTPEVHLTQRTGAGSQASRIMIASNGEVGIGILNPQDYGASGHGYLGLTVQAPSGGYSGITIRSNYAGGGALCFSDGTGSNAELKNIALQADHVNKRLDFMVDGSTKFRITTNGIHPNPADTAAANALDDYEEGSWNPLWSNSASNSGGTTTSNNMHGRYTKIGKIVHAYFYTWGLPAGNSGNMYLQGLPFSCASNPGAYFCAVQSAFYNFGADNYYNLGLRLSTNRTFAELIFCRKDPGNYVPATFAGFINYYTNFNGVLTYEAV